MDYQQGYGYGGLLQDHSYQPQNVGYQYQQDPTAYYQNYQTMQQTPQMYQTVQTGSALDYQMAPAWYVLNQQAKILENSLLPGMIDQPVSSKPKRRKQRGPYKKKNAKSPSPEPSTQALDNAYFQTAVQGSNKRWLSSCEDDAQMYQPVAKQMKTDNQGTMAQMKVSIFRCVELLAQSSVNNR